MTKSYYIEDAPENVTVLGESYQNGYIVHCYEDDDCIFTKYFADRNRAVKFGNKYLDSDWNTTGFPRNAVAA